MLLQLYLHFPFCKSKCRYCDFCSFASTEADMLSYAALLTRELEMIAAQYPDAKVSSVFCGGGTPSLMPVRAMEGIWRTVRDCFTLLPNAEYTVEANPGTLTREWLTAARSFGVNRLSLGVQASQDSLLKRLGRIHRFADVTEAAAIARDCGIDNINMDVMFGLPGQRLSDYLETLESVGALTPRHISAYSLIVEENTPLHGAVEQGLESLPSDDETTEMYEQGAAWLAQRGYAQYEISNFAQSGFECRHNLGYWQGAWYAGLGLNAHGKLPSPDTNDAYLRVENTAELSEYQALIESGQLPIAGTTHISPADAMFETMMLGLRTTMGVSEALFLRLHQKTMMSVYGAHLESLIKDGLGEWRSAANGQRAFALTPKGLLVQNTALMYLM